MEYFTKEVFSFTKDIFEEMADIGYNDLKIDHRHILAKTLYTLGTIKIKDGKEMKEGINEDL